MVTPQPQLGNIAEALALGNSRRLKMAMIIYNGKILDSCINFYACAAIK
jgi:hypothetical protein